MPTVTSRNCQVETIWHEIRRTVIPGTNIPVTSYEHYRITDTGPLVAGNVYLVKGEVYKSTLNCDKPSFDVYIGILVKHGGTCSGVRIRTIPYIIVNCGDIPVEEVKPPEKEDEVRKPVQRPIVPPWNYEPPPEGSDKPPEEPFEPGKGTDELGEGDPGPPSQTPTAYDRAAVFNAKLSPASLAPPEAQVRDKLYSGEGYFKSQTDYLKWKYSMIASGTNVVEIPASNGPQYPFAFVGQTNYSLVGTGQYVSRIILKTEPASQTQMENAAAELRNLEWAALSSMPEDEVMRALGY